MAHPQSEADRASVLTRAVLRAAERLGLSRRELADTLGLSPATLSRMYQGRYTLDEKSKTWELAALLVRLYRGLDAITAGDETSQRAWMRNPNLDLHRPPVELITTVAGLAHTVTYVDAHRARL